MMDAAHQHAAAGRFADMLALCVQQLSQPEITVDQRLAIGGLLLSQGFLTDARCCFEQAQALAPHDLRPTVGRALRCSPSGIARCAWAMCRRIFASTPWACSSRTCSRRTTRPGCRCLPIAQGRSRIG